MKATEKLFFLISEIVSCLVISFLLLLCGCASYTAVVATNMIVTKPFRSKIPEMQSVTAQMVSGDEALFFIMARSEAEGLWWELWVTDGTAQNTRLVKKMFGDSSLDVRRGITINDLTFFVANGSNVQDFRTDHPTLWVTDRTEEGTKRVTTSSNIPHSPDDLTNINGTLFFTAPEYRREGSICTTWQTKGTDAQTLYIKKIDQQCRLQTLDNKPNLSLFHYTLPSKIDFDDCSLWHDTRGKINKNHQAYLCLNEAILNNGITLFLVQKEDNVVEYWAVEHENPVLLKTFPIIGDH